MSEQQPTDLAAAQAELERLADQFIDSGDETVAERKAIFEDLRHATQLVRDLKQAEQ